MGHQPSSNCEVAIIGTGPYGLSLAAHLQARNINYRIFGKPMDLWRSHMPKSMKLKSEGFASNLSAPDGQSRLKDFCLKFGKPYADEGYPIPLTDFVEYADWFRSTHVPNLEENMITMVEGGNEQFTLHLDSGERVTASNVVLAVGISWFPHIPPELSLLPGHLVSHSYDHRTVNQFKDREVIVVGAGASAINLAHELAEAGSSVRILARAENIEYHEAPTSLTPPLWQRLLSPSSPIGSGWRSLLCCMAPALLYRLPSHIRARTIRSHLRPAGGWFMRDKVIGRVPCLLGRHVQNASVINGRINLILKGDAAAKIECDHVIAATGYRIDLNSLPFLGKGIRSLISKKNGSPALTPNFETSLKGLYAIGPMAMESYGPLLRFMAGAEFAAPRLARTLHRRIVMKRAREAFSSFGKWAIARLTVSKAFPTPGLKMKF